MERLQALIDIIDDVNTRLRGLMKEEQLKVVTAMTPIPVSPVAQDPIKSWAYDTLKEEIGEVVRIALLYQHYKDTQVEKGVPSIKLADIRVFTRNINKYFPNIVKGKATIGKKQVAIFNGLRFKNEHELTTTGGF